MAAAAVAQEEARRHQLGEMKASFAPAAVSGVLQLHEGEAVPRTGDTTPAANKHNTTKCFARCQVLLPRPSSSLQWRLIHCHHRHCRCHP